MNPLQQALSRQVYCEVCGLPKKPVGRDAAPAMANSLCDSDCPGYRLKPYPSNLWPGEQGLLKECGISKDQLRIKRERDALLKACIAAHERFEVLIDAEEATDGDEKVRDMLSKAIHKATGVRP